MEYWGYEEATRDIKDVYQDMISQNEGKERAIILTYNDFDNMGKVEDIIVDVAVGELMIETGVGIKEYVNAISRRLSVFDPAIVGDELTQEELEDLIRRIKNMLNGFKTLEIYPSDDD